MRPLSSHYVSLAALLAIGAGCSETEIGSRSLSASGQFLSGSYGGHNYKLYIPSGYAAGQRSPLLLMMHGCLQDPSQFATTTAMNALAETGTALVIYPEQPTSANGARCWNWFNPGDQGRGAGEPGFMAGLVGQIQGQYTIDAERVYAVGFSAGGGMATVLGATYPDLFAAIVVASGLEYAAASSSGSAFGVMQSGGPDPLRQGQAAYQAMGPRARVVPVLVFHGSKDTTVAPINGQQALTQFARTDDLADDGSANGSISGTPALTETLQVPGGRSYTHYVYNDGAGRPLLERYLIDGMAHAWSGGRGSSYADAKGPDATALTWAFLMAHPRGGGGAPVDMAGGPRDMSGGADLATRDMSSGADLGARDMAGGADLATRDMSSPADLGGGSQATFGSIAAEDGFAGALLVDGAGTSARKAGDKGLFNAESYRCVLSFDTSALPDGAALRSAKLRVFRKALTGTVSQVSVDVRSGYFGSSSAIEQADFAAAATRSAVATKPPPAANGDLVEFDLTAALTAINKTGKTQVRLKAQTPVDFSSDIIEFHGGDAGALAPQLIVEY